MKKDVQPILKSILFSVSITCFLVNSAIAEPPSFVTLPEQANGQAAIAALERAGALQKVANAHRMTAAKLREIFEHDDSLHVDKSGNLLYVEAAHESEAGGAEDGAGIADPDGVYGPEQAFQLHSDPDSSKTLYLDFTGAVVSGTAWNNTTGIDPQTHPPFDLDGVPTSFNDTERNRIIAIWRRVVEDFAPFDVNVTTEEPAQSKISRAGSSDQEYGSIALITKSFSPYSGGGVAYYGAFGSTSDSTKPAMVFFNRLGNGIAKYIAEAISHEFGHNLDLRHDGKSGDSDEYYDGHGSGETGWASIMGVGYYKNLSQWSKGEYSGATNTQDDYLAMANRGLLARADDHGNSRSNATFLDQGTTFGTTGVIQERSDVDFISFNAGAGTLDIDVFTVNNGPNLDVLLKVFTASGQLIGQANPENLLDASLSISLASDGVYYASIEGTGKGDVSGTGYSDYGSLGHYTVVGSVSNTNGNSAPTAIASSDITSGLAALTVQFDGSGSADSDGSIVSYSWNFGDGGSASLVSPSHTFEAAGSYEVTLVVTDDGGLQDIDTLTIAVQDPPNVAPTAVASANPNPVMELQAVSFNGAGSFDTDGSISSYAWNFGDGTSSSAMSPSHSYSTAGDYTVTLTVTDNDGDSDSVSLSLTVTDDPTALPTPTLSLSVSGNSAALSWTDGTNKEDGFRVQKRSVEGKGKNKTYSSWQTIASLNENVTSFTDVAGLSSTTNEYRIEIWNSAGGSEYSNIRQAKAAKAGGGGGKGKKK